MLTELSDGGNEDRLVVSSAGRHWSHRGLWRGQRRAEVAVARQRRASGSGGARAVKFRARVFQTFHGSGRPKPTCFRIAIGHLDQFGVLAFPFLQQLRRERAPRDLAEPQAANQHFDR